MRIESQNSFEKLAHVGGFRGHLNTETTSHVYKLSGWRGPGRQELWPVWERCMSHFLVGASCRAIKHILTTALDSSEWLAHFGDSRNYSCMLLPAMSATSGDDISPTFQTLKQSLAIISTRPLLSRSRSRSLPERASPQLETKERLQDAALRAEASPSAGEIAITTLQYLPVPTIVLSSLKQVILVNEALKSLLATVDAEEDTAVSNGAFSQTPGAETLLGRSLSQLGIQMVAEGDQTWTTLEV